MVMVKYVCACADCGKVLSACLSEFALEEVDYHEACEEVEMAPSGAYYDFVIETRHGLCSECQEQDE